MPWKIEKRSTEVLLFVWFVFMLLMGREADRGQLGVNMGLNLVLGRVTLVIVTGFMEFIIVTMTYNLQP